MNDNRKYLLQLIDGLKLTSYGPYACEQDRVQEARKSFRESPDDQFYCLDVGSTDCLVYGIGTGELEVPWGCPVCGDLLSDEEVEIREHMAGHHAGANAMSIEQLRESLEVLE